MSTQVRGSEPNVGGYLVIGAIAVLVRLALALSAPGEGGDTSGYFTIALNIVENGCVSLSEPATGVCEPDWGGNQLPGYPTFIALVWAISGVSPLAVRVAQALVVVGAGLWLVHAVARYTGSWRAALFVGLVMALSPLQAAWPRLALTETLALATTMWVLAELVLSLAEGRLRIWTTAIALAAAVFVRYDGVLMCLPVAFCAFVIHGPRRALLRGGAIALILAIPVLAWVARSADAGLGYVPTIWSASVGGSADGGFISWARTWSTHEYDFQKWSYPLGGQRYSQIRIDDRAFDDDEEGIRVARLLGELARFDGEPFPAHVNAAFAALADERRARDPLRHWAWNPLRRAANMWFTPFSSFGWPLEVPDALRDAVRTAAFGGVAAAIAEHPLIAAGKALVNGYRFLLVIGFVAAGIYAIMRRKRYLLRLLGIAVLIVAARTVFFSELALMETRYIMETVPGLELVAVLALWETWRRRGRAPQPAST